jgi:hypothetical protein
MAIPNTPDAAPGGATGRRRWRPRTRRGIILWLAGAVIVAVAVAAGLLAGPAGPAPASSHGLSAAPAGGAAFAADDDYLSAVSCASARFCAAVGSYTHAGRSQVLAESWNGARWSLAGTPALPGTSQLAGVSCASARLCLAVGSRRASGAAAGQVLAESWNGRRWSLLPAPAAAPGETAALTAVSCPSAGFCAAIGQQRAAGQPATALLLTWTAGKWAAAAAPGLPPGMSYALSALSCASPRSCMTAGAATTAAAAKAGSTAKPATTAKALALAWDGSRWQVTPAPDPGGKKAGVPDALSCVSASSCTAVARYVDGGAYQPLAETWDGSRWTVTPGPAAGATDLLFAVSCTASQACAAVGWWHGAKTTPGIHTLAGIRGPGGWTVRPSPDTAPADTDALFGVSCTGPRYCAAVGYYEHGPRNHVLSRTLIQTWNGRQWTMLPSPNK